jgi:WD40 repeat protein
MECCCQLALSGHGKKVLWSPDGRYLLSSAVDGVGVTVFSAAPSSSSSVAWNLRPACKVASPDVAVSDMAWYPGGECFVATSKSQPCLLRDVTGVVRASYISLDASEDRPDPTLAIAWSGDGVRLFGTTGAGACLWDPSRPGTPARSWKSRDQVGKLSCLAFCNSLQVLAAGSFSGRVGLFDSSGKLQTLMENTRQKAGVTQVAWTSDNTLVVGGRRSEQMTCFDVRNPDVPLFALERPVYSNQRVFFCVTQDEIWSGDGSAPLGLVSVWNSRSGEKLADLPICSDVVCSVDVNPKFPVFAVTTGQRYSANPDNIIGIFRRTQL